MHCVHSKTVLSISQVTKAATEEWIRAVSGDSLVRVPGDSHHTLLRSRAGTKTGFSGLSGNWNWWYFWLPLSSPGPRSGERVYVPFPSAVPPPPAAHSQCRNCFLIPPLWAITCTKFQSIGKVSWTHLGIGIWKIELVQTVFPCIQETSDC